MRPYLRNTKIIPPKGKFLSKHAIPCPRSRILRKKKQLSEWLQTALDDFAEFENSIETYLDNPAANQVTLDDILGSCPAIQKTPNLSRATSIVSSTATNASEKLRLAKACHTARQQFKLKRQNLESAQFDENQCHSQESLLQEHRQKQESLLYEQRQKQDYLLHEKAQFELRQRQEDLDLEQEGWELHLMEQALEPPVISDVLVEHSPERLMLPTWRSQQLEVGTPPRRIERPEMEPPVGADSQLSSFNIEP